MLSHAYLNNSRRDRSGSGAKPLPSRLSKAKTWLATNHIGEIYRIIRYILSGAVAIHVSTSLATTARQPMAKTGVGSTSAKSTPQQEAKPREVGITDRVVLLCSTSWKIDTRMKSTERPFLSPIAHSFILSVCYCYPVVENATGAYFGLLCASLIVQCPPTSAFRFSFPYRVAVGAVCRGVVLCCLASLDNPAKRARARGFLNVYKRF